MAANPLISEDSFLTFTTLEGIDNATTRKIVASNAQKVARRQRKKPAKVNSQSIIRSFLLWRYGASQGGKSAAQVVDSDLSQIVDRRAALETRHLSCSPPPSLQPLPSLQRSSPGARIDPFASFPAKIDTDAAGALRFCVSQP